MSLEALLHRVDSTETMKGAWGGGDRRMAKF